LSQGERRLAAIMFTDMVGYTALTQSDETQALDVLDRHNRLLKPIFPKFHGRVVKTIGDSFMVEFDSAQDAVNCAVELQRVLHDYNISSRDEWKITLRIGIHLGDVVHSGGDVFGDAVNIASRLQPLAEPEGICVSDQVFGQVRNKISQTLVKLEPRDLKGIKFAVDVYKVVMPWEREPYGSTAPAERNRVAVLPFANMSPDPSDEYFADGMTEELIDRLAQVKGLEVIARTSVMAYKKKETKAGDIGRELRVGALVEGSVRKAGNKVRVTAQLINTTTEGHLWSSHYDGTLDDIFAVQSEIAAKVAGELSVQLLETEREGMEKRQTENTEAYTFFLQGRELRHKGNEDSVREAMKLIDRALALDPSFAAAYCELARCHQFLGNGGYEDYHESITNAKVPLKRALDLDPGLSEAHAFLSLLLFNEDDIAGAELEARRAIELNPSLPDAYDALCNVQGIWDDVDEVGKLVETYYRLDPIRPSYVVDLGTLYFYTGRDSEALEHWRKTVDLAPAGTYRVMAEYYLSKGDYGRAKELHSKVQALDPNSPWLIWTGGYMSAMTGDRNAALKAIEDLQSPKLGALRLNWIGFVHYALGNFDSYFDFVNQALDSGALAYAYVMHCPLFAKGRELPRYAELRERMDRKFRASKAS